MSEMDKNKNIFQGLVKDGSFKWLLSRKSTLEEEFEQLGRKVIAELSPVANVVVGRCSRVLDVSMDALKECFDKEASDPIKHPSCYARNFLEYCCFRALSLSAQPIGQLSDKDFRRLTFDMMLAWDTPAASNQAPLKVEIESTVGLKAFSRIAPAAPIIADVTTCSALFEILTAGADGRLSFSRYDKYLIALVRAIKNMKSKSDTFHLSNTQSGRKERVLDLDGTLTTKPVIEHTGMSLWPGRLTLTDHGLYFETHRVVAYDKPKVYDFADDLKHSIKADLTGPLGARLFDKAVMYKSTSLSEPVVLEFPEMTGHSRRDYWLAIIQEIIYVHEFIRKFKLSGIEKEEVLSKAILSILRLQAVNDSLTSTYVQPDLLLMFNVCDQLPGGDLILETLARRISSQRIEQTANYDSKSGMHSISSSSILSNLGFLSNDAIGSKLLVGELVVGELNCIEKAVVESRSSLKHVKSAQATVNGVKVEGIGTNLAVMKELFYPIIELIKKILSLEAWDNPMSSFFFCIASSYIIWRGWVGFSVALLLLFTALFLVITRCYNRGKPIVDLKVTVPPSMNTMEQLLAVQNVICQVEEIVQDGNIFLLKLRALFLSGLPQATDRVVIILIVLASIITFLPAKFLVLAIFLEIFTRNSSLRKADTERCTRRLRDWWFSIPAAPVFLIKCKEDKKKK